MDYIGILLHAFRCAVILDKHLDVKVNHTTFFYLWLLRWEGNSPPAGIIYQSLHRGKVSHSVNTARAEQQR